MILSNQQVLTFVESNNKQETTVLNATHRLTNVLLISDIASDLDKQSQMNKQAAHDRMLVVARAKDQIKHEMLQEMDRMRKKLKQEHK